MSDFPARTSRASTAAASHRSLREHARFKSEDVRSVIETARAVALSPDREIIHILPQEFTVDDQNGIGDPLGMVGTRLEVNVHIVTSSTTAAQNIVTAVIAAACWSAIRCSNRLLPAKRFFPKTTKNSESCWSMSAAARRNVAMYHRGAVRHTVVVPVGGEHFTNDIAVGCEPSFRKPNGSNTSKAARCRRWPTRKMCLK